LEVFWFVWDLAWSELPSLKVSQTVDHQLRNPELDQQLVMNCEHFGVTESTPAAQRKLIGQDPEDSRLKLRHRWLNPEVDQRCLPHEESLRLWRLPLQLL
jgi:hypothetical protein